MVVDAAHAHDIGPITDAEDGLARPSAFDDRRDTQPEHHLRDLGDPVPALDEAAFRRGVIADPVGVGAGGSFLR